MSKINLELFGRNSEILSFEYKKENYLRFEFTEDICGYINLGRVTARLIDGKCAVDVQNLECGDHIPRLILTDMTIDLPAIRNENGAIYPREHNLQEIGELSLRERRLCRRVNELEKRLEEISKKVFGSKIF